MEQTVLNNIENNITRTNLEQLHYQKKNSVSYASTNYTQSSNPIDVRVTPVHSPIQVNCLLLFSFTLCTFISNFR